MEYLTASLEHHQQGVGGLGMHWVAAGPAEGPMVLLLHGFPEFWYGWRHQIQPLAEAGYRVIAPDQRGYNRSDKPARVQDYRMEPLMGDVIGLMDHLGREQAHLVGHDWGAAVAWWTALHHPVRVETLSILNVPHPGEFWEAIRRSWEQRLRSWYILFFQLPWLPEALLGAADFRLLAATLQRSSLPGTFGLEDLRLYRQAWSQPGALQGMLNWYRAALRHRFRLEVDTRVVPPTLMLWGARDLALMEALAWMSMEHCPKGRLVVFPEASHWVQHERARVVNRRLLEHWASPP